MLETIEDIEDYIWRLKSIDDQNNSVLSPRSML